MFKVVRENVVGVLLVSLATLDFLTRSRSNKFFDHLDIFAVDLSVEIYTLENEFYRERQNHVNQATVLIL